MQKIYKECKVRISLWSKLVLMVVGIGAASSSWGQMAGDFQTRSTTGNWSNFNSWNIRNITNTAWIAATAGQLPSPTTDVFIQAAHTITVDNSTAVCKSINASAALTARIAFSTATSVLSVNGDLILITGGHNLFGAWTAGAKFVFVGSANQTTTNLTGSTTFVNLEVNKIGSSISTDGNLRFSTVLNIVSGTLVTGTAQDIQGTSNTSNITIQSSGTITQTGGASVIRVGSSGSSPIGNVVVNGTLNINTTTGISAINVASLSIEDNGATGGVVNVNFTNAAGAVIAATAGGVTIRNNAALNIASTCRTTWIAASTNLTLQSGGFLNISNPSFVLPTSYTFLGTVSYNNGSQTIAAATTYTNLTLSSVSTPANKTFTTGQNVNGNLLISGNAVLLGGTNLINIGGNWTNYATGGFTEGTCIVNFNGTGAQSINTTGGEDFYRLNKTGTGILTLNSDARFGGSLSALNISAGIMDAGTNTLSGTTLAELRMSGGILKLGKPNVTLPEFDIIAAGYVLTGGTIELNGVGDQILRGARDYRNLTFSTSGIKTISSAPSTISGTISVENVATLNVSTNSMGGSGTNLTMTGTSRYITAGTGTKPDAQGTYTLAAGTTVEFNNNSLSEQEIRLSPSYHNIVVSGSSVANASLASTSLNIQTGGSFTVTNTGTFKTMNVNGFSGANSTTISSTNSPTINLQDGSTIEYYRNDGVAQNISSAVNIGQGTTGNYYSLRLSGTGNKTAPSTTLEIRGNLTGAGTAAFVHSNGTVLFNGTAGQTYSSSTEFPFYNLTNSSTLAGGGFTVNSNLSVEKELRLNTLSSILLNTGDVALKSSSTNTANVAAVPNEVNIIQYPGVGRFNVERYLSAYKSWRLLATPVQSFSEDATAASINDAWREGGTSLTSTGFGTRITGTGALGLPAGLDENTPFPSMKYYNMATNNYIGITSADLASNRTIANNEGYYVFVRGDRAEDVFSAGASTNLRIKGKLRTQGQTFTVNANAFQSVGNPFASQIDFKTVAKTNVTESFYVWNPASAGSFGVGAFEVYARELVTPFDYRLNGTGTVRNTIESGQAFFIQSVSGGTITINEADKQSLSNNVSRAAEAGRNGVSIPTLEINLIAKNSNIETFADAASINYDESLSNEIDNYDVRKISNTYDNLSVLNNTTKLVVERRNKLQVTDTIKINISGIRVADYKLDIKPSALSGIGLVGILKDKFLQNETVLSLDNKNAVDFSVTSDAGSRAADRFMIVFKSSPTSSFTTISANRNADKTVQVNWGVHNEIGIASFELQQSNDAINFTTIKTKNPSANNGNNATYQIIDDNAANGNNWYRIKMNHLSSAKYSAVAMVVGINENIVDTKPSFVISPNPVLDSKINCTSINKAFGKYSVTVLNMEGQKIYSGVINVSSSNQSITIALDRSVAKGSYKLLLLDEKGKQESVGLMIQ